MRLLMVCLGAALIHERECLGQDDKVMDAVGDAEGAGADLGGVPIDRSSRAGLGVEVKSPFHVVITITPPEHLSEYLRKEATGRCPGAPLAVCWRVTLHCSRGDRGTVVNTLTWAEGSGPLVVADGVGVQPADWCQAFAVPVVASLAAIKQVGFVTCHGERDRCVEFKMPKAGCHLAHKCCEFPKDAVEPGQRWPSSRHSHFECVRWNMNPLGHTCRGQTREVDGKIRHGREARTLDGKTSKYCWDKEGWDQAHLGV